MAMLYPRTITIENLHKVKDQDRQVTQALKQQSAVSKLTSRNNDKLEKSNAITSSRING